MSPRSSKTIPPRPNYPQVGRATLPDGGPVQIGDMVRIDPPGKARSYLAKVTRLDLEEADGPLRDVTVCVWSRLNGTTHPQHGMTRTFFPAAVKLV